MELSKLSDHRLENKCGVNATTYKWNFTKRAKSGGKNNKPQQANCYLRFCCTHFVILLAVFGLFLGDDFRLAFAPETWVPSHMSQRLQLTTILISWSPTTNARSFKLGQSRTYLLLTSKPSYSITAKYS